MKFVVHFTTIPTRSTQIKKTIDSWLNQTHPVEKVVITLQKNCTLPMLDYGETRVEFQYVNENSGPSDKIIGALMYYQNLRDDSDKNQTYFIIGDDDLVYNQDTVRIYRDEYVQDPNRVYTFFQKQERFLRKI